MALVELTFTKEQRHSFSQLGWKYSEPLAVGNWTDLGACLRVHFASGPDPRVWLIHPDGKIERVVDKIGVRV